MATRIGGNNHNYNNLSVGKAAQKQAAGTAAPAGKAAPAAQVPGDTVNIKVEKGAALTNLTHIADVDFSGLPDVGHIQCLEHAGDKLKNRHEEMVPGQLAKNLADVIFGSGTKVA